MPGASSASSSDGYPTGSDSPTGQILYLQEPIGDAYNSVTGPFYVNAETDAPTTQAYMQFADGGLDASIEVAWMASKLSRKQETLWNEVAPWARSDAHLAMVHSI
mmetsp:Transcript_51006/g.114780  ORF Transcript_51006/g.114780 Transcript_51006/m.114780 type:complete len:105 (-) Transcript_51006:48-362(-)